MQLNCALHKNSVITHYCETCLDLVCEVCTSKQPHSGPNHEIIDLIEAANMRKNHYLHYINTQVNPIRSTAQQRITKLHQIKDGQQNICKVIRKDIRVQFQSIRTRLQQAVNSNITEIHVQMKNYQMYVQELDDLFDAFNEVYDDPHAFLISYLNFDKQIKKLQSIDFSNQKVYRQKWTQKITELPRQLLQIYKKVDTLPAYQDRNLFMNKVMEKYLKYFHQRIKQQKANTLLKAKKINHTYNQVISKIVQEQQTARVCIFCGNPFTIQNVNEGCSYNRTYKMKPIYPDINWDAIIPSEVRGSKRHFWYASDSLHRKRPTLDSHSIIRKTLKKHYFNSLSQLQSVKFALRKYHIDNQKQLQQLFLPNDPQKTGCISKVAFKYIMSKTYKISQNLINSLILLLQEEKGINYRKLEQVLNNPVEDYFKFEKQQQQMQRSKPIAPPSLSRYRY